MHACLPAHPFRPLRCGALSCRHCRRTPCRRAEWQDAAANSQLPDKAKPDYDYSEALHKSLIFYDSQVCWRCATLFSLYFDVVLSVFKLWTRL